MIESWLVSFETLRSAVDHQMGDRFIFYRQIKKRTTSQQKHVKKVSAQAINTLKELEMALKTLKVEIPGSKSELQKQEGKRRQREVCARGLRLSLDCFSRTPLTSFVVFFIYLGRVQVAATWLFQHVQKIYIKEVSSNFVTWTSKQACFPPQNRLLGKQVGML